MKRAARRRVEATMTMGLSWLRAAVLLAVLAPAAARAATPAELAAQVDALHAHRDDPAQAQAMKALVTQAVAQAPRDYGLLWRAARAFFWLGDNPDLSKHDRSVLGKQGWDYAERAVAVNPNGVEGHFFAAVDIGTYAEDVSTWTAVRQGLEGKFKDHLTRAQQIAPGFEHGAIENAWGRYYAEVPWPHYDAKAAEQHYRRAMQVDPGNLRARAWLADVWRKEKRTAEARQLASQVLGMRGPGWDVPEDRRAMRIAQRVLERAAAPAAPAAHNVAAAAPPPPPPPPPHR